MVFSKRNKKLPVDLKLTFNEHVIVPTDKCIYLGLTFDSQLSWRTHIALKVASSKRLFFMINKCFRLTWGLSRDKLLLVYKTIFIPQILYGCPVWAGALKFKWCVKALRSSQRPLALAIS